MSPEAMQLRQAERLVLEYVVEHPSAKDTAEGIRLWWLPQAKLAEDTLREALCNLVAKGWFEVRVTARESGEEAQVYGLNPGMLAEIQHALAATGGAAHHGADTVRGGEREPADGIGGGRCDG